MADVKIYAKALKPCKKCRQNPILTWDYHEAGKTGKVFYVICDCKRKPRLYIDMDSAIKGWNKEQNDNH